MTDKEMAVIIYKRLKLFIIHSDWLNINTQEQARALFTTLCIIGGMEADTSVCDNILLELYNNLGTQNIDIQYNDFENFMIGLMV
jgi:hypothetical protein